jgi:4-amino-4-deoxy-L-arabinose transferase-like glycosyltransferase
MSTIELLRTPRSASSRTRRRNQRSDARAADPAWARPALLVLLALTAFAYAWDLSASGYANSFYAAAVQAGTKSWKAFFFGSLDASSFITVDKPPASLWVMELSGRIFGFGSWSLLVPQALEGVAAVALAHATVKRWFGAAAGLLAGAAFAFTPVAALMFRFDNPDALLVLLMVAGAYCLTRALERAGTRWVLAAGTLIGLAFLAKMMQAFLVLPAFALVYALAAPTTLRRRIGQLAAGGAAVLLSAGWWVAIVALWPAGSRPMIDGSPDNSILNLIFGYNGLGRIFGSTGPGGGGGANFSGATGPLRLFNDLMGGQASWLLPAALLALGAGLWSRRGRPRTDRPRAALLLWGGWLLVTGAVFSFGQGVIHTYYTVALAPAIGALVAIGAKLAYDRREHPAARLLFAVALAASGAWGWVLLDRTPSWLPWLRVLVAVACLLGALGVLLAPTLRRARPTVAVLAVVLGLIGAFAGPLAYAADTVTTAHTGSVPSAGPAGAAGLGGAPGGFAHGRPGAGVGIPGGQALFGDGSSDSTGSTGVRAVRSGAPDGPGVGGTAGGSSAAGGATRPGAGAGVGAAGQQSVGSALVSALRSDAGSYRWVAATDGSQSAATLELATGDAVMAIGGFSGEGGHLTLAEFERYVRAGEIHYFIAGSGMGGAGGPGAGGGGTAPAGGARGGMGGYSDASILSWVEAHFKSETIGGETVYDLSSAS